MKVLNYVLVIRLVVIYHNYILIFTLNSVVTASAIHGYETRRGKHLYILCLHLGSRVITLHAVLIMHMGIFLLHLGT